MMKLVLGDKQYSSWSIRGLLILKEKGIDFEEIYVGSDWPVKIIDGRVTHFHDGKNYGFPVLYESCCCCEVTQLENAIGKNIIDSSVVYKMHRVPTLYDERNNVCVSEIMEINQYLEDLNCGKSLLSNDLKLKSEIRSLSNHLIGDYLPLYAKMSYGKSFYSGENYKELDDDILVQANEYLSLLEYVLDLYKGEYLFGKFSLADIIVAPTAITFIGWKYPLSGKIKNYFDTLTNRPAVKEVYDYCVALYCDMKKYEKGTENWIANQFRYNNKYKMINQINKGVYHRINNDVEFEALKLAKQGYKLNEIVKNLNCDEIKIKDLFNYLNSNLC